MPWGGTFQVQNETFRIVNSCPIDNYLFMFANWFHNNIDELLNFPIQQQVKECLVTSIHLITERMYGSAKAKWMSNFNNFPHGFLLPDNKSAITLYGNEFEMFVNLLRPMFSTEVEAVCSAANCPKKTCVHVMNSIVLRLFEQLGSSSPNCHERALTSECYLSSILSAYKGFSR